MNNLNSKDTASFLQKYKDAISFAQELPPSPVYVINNLPASIIISQKTIRRRLKQLEEIGLADYNRGKFTIKREVVSQPQIVLQKILSSLLALKESRRFGRFYRETDVKFMLKHLPKNSMITLDYSVHEITKYQTPLTLYVYVDDVQKTADFLKKYNFSEGKRGNIVLLPKIGTFDNKIERIFQDCVAHGGRSFLDAAALLLTNQDKIKTRVRFTADMLLKVQEDMAIK